MIPMHVRLASGIYCNKGRRGGGDKSLTSRDERLDIVVRSRLLGNASVARYGIYEPQYTCLRAIPLSDFHGA